MSIKKSKNVVTGSIDAGGNVHLGDIIHHYHQYGDKKIRKILGQAPFLPDLFIGRDQDLENVHQKLFQGNNLLLLVNGQGGIGKTSLAAHYYFKYHDHYNHLAWVFAEQSLLDALLTLAVPLEVAFPEKMPNTERLQVLLDHLRQLQKPCLLVIDNANRLEDLQQHYLALRSCPNFHLLLTTRITEFENAERYAIQALQDHYPIELFQTHYGKPLQATELELLKQILEAVSYNTLVIELLAKNLRSFNRLKTQYSLQDLLQDLQNKGLLAVQTKPIKTGYQAKDQLREEKPEDIIAAMYDLNELSLAENQLLSIFAVLPAENIPFETLETLITPFQIKETVANKGFWKRLTKGAATTQTKTLSTEEVENILISLYHKGWLDYNEPSASFKCSPVIQEITRHKNHEQLLEHCDTLLDSLIDKLAYETGVGHFKNATYEAAALYARYGESVVNNIDIINFSLSGVCERLGNYYNTIGSLENAIHFYNSYKEYAKQLSEAYPDNVDYKNNLAISYSKLGETQSALGNLEAALRFFEDETQLFEELHEAYPTNVGFKNGLAISYSKLGETQSALGNLEAALRFFEDFNSLMKELYEAYPSNVGFKNGLAISYSKLGETQSALGNLEAALRFFEDFNSLMKELYEAYPSNVGFKNGLAISYEKLGSTHSALGNLEQALRFFEDETQLFEELYEAYPTNVGFKNGLAISYSKLGETQSDLGNLEAALRFFEQDAQLTKELYEAYPTNVGFKNGLAISYSKLGETQSALGNLEAALRFFEERNRLGKELYEAYPTNVGFKNGLAISYYKLGEFYRDHSNDKNQARTYFLEAEAHWAALVTAFPAYVEFQRNFEEVKEALASLSEP